MPPNGVEEWRARIGQWENRKLRWYQAHSGSRRRVPLNLGRLIADLPNLCLVLLLLSTLDVGISVCEAGKGALRSLVIRGRCCVRSVTSRPTALFSIFLALSLLLIVAGDIETNPGPISDDFLARVDDSELTEDDLHDVYAAVHTLRARWSDLCFALKLSHAEEKTIDETHRGNPGKCLREALFRWVCKNYRFQKYGHPSWRFLVQAVGDPIGGNDCALAETIGKNHTTPMSRGEGKSNIPQASSVGLAPNPTRMVRRPPRGRGKRGGLYQAPSMRGAHDPGTAKVSETQLKLNDLGRLKQCLRDVSAYWVPLADQLGMTSQVATIRGTPDNTVPSAFMRDLLNRWLSREHPSPTLEVLCQALKGDDEIIGGADAARKLEEGFPGQLETQDSGQHPGMRSSQQTPQPVQVYSETKVPKSKGILGEYAEYLRRKYRTEIPAVSLQWPPPPTRKVFNLAMIERGTNYIRDEECSRLLLHGDVAGIMHKKEVKLEDIVKPDEESNMILIEGAPGAGKSTLAWHICQKWGKGELFQEFVMIIFMQLRDLAIQSATTLANILSETDHGPKPEEVISAIKVCDGKHVLFVLDGWDEFPPGLHKASIIKCLICQPADFGMSSRTLIITSRPIATAELRHFASSRVEIVGFQQAEMKRYFTEAVHKPQIVQKLEDHLKLRPVIEASCYLPLNAAIVVHIFLALNYSLPTTLHGVFTSLVLCCITRHLTRQAGEGEEIPDISSLNDLPADIQEPFNNICTLAYHGAIENKPTFSKADLQSYHLPTELSTLSLIQAVNSFTVLGKSKSYSFLHLSVQELLAAFHISRTSPEQQVKIFAELFEEPRFAAVFQFYAAFTKLQSEGVRNVVTRIVQRESVLLLLSLLRCLYETRDVSLCKFVASQLNGELDLSRESVSPVDCLSVGYFLNSVCQTTSGEFKVHLSYCSLNDYSISLLWKELFECSGTPAVGARVEGHLHLNLAGNNIGDGGAASIAATLKEDQILKALNLRNNDIGDNGAASLGAALKENRTLKELKLRRCGVTSTGAIAEALLENKTLEILNIDSNDFGDEGVTVLASALKKNETLKTLDLFNCGVTSTGAIAEALQENKTLEILNLSSNDIGDEGATVLASALKKNETLKTLNLQLNKIGDAGAVSLGEALRVNHSLKRLYLGGQGLYGGDKISSEKQSQLTQEFGSRITF